MNADPWTLIAIALVMLAVIGAGGAVAMYSETKRAERERQN